MVGAVALSRAASAAARLVVVRLAGHARRLDVYALCIGVSRLLAGGRRRALLRRRARGRCHADPPAAETRAKHRRTHVLHIGLRYDGSRFCRMFPSTKATTARIPLLALPCRSRGRRHNNLFAASEVLYFVRKQSAQSCPCAELPGGSTYRWAVRVLCALRGIHVSIAVSWMFAVSCGWPARPCNERSSPFASKGSQPYQAGAWEGALTFEN
mmetsp:Transcript_23259/g.50855  ORF Transcript_23259/g.50855 Transcript_23259/m.50855 type:complete len:212 (-) Transcript_23259:40-675(-)